MKQICLLPLFLCLALGSLVSCKNKGKKTEEKDLAETTAMAAPGNPDPTVNPQTADEGKPAETADEEAATTKVPWWKKVFSGKKKKAKPGETVAPDEAASSDTAPAENVTASTPKPASPKPAAPAPPKPKPVALPEPPLDSPATIPSSPAPFQPAITSPLDLPGDSAVSPLLPANPGPPLPSAPATPSAPSTVEPTTYPSGTTIEGTPTRIRSPYGNKGLIDREGIPSGALIKCPYTNRWLRVP